MRFSLSVLGGCVVSSMENGRRGEKKERKKERKHCAIWKGKEDGCGSKSLWDSSFGFSSTCYGRFRIFLLFLTHWIYICISTFTSKFVWTSWGGNFGKSLEVNFSPWNANWIVTFSNWLFPRPIWFFFFLANFDHFKNIFFFFFPWSLTELSRIDRKGDVITIGKTRREDFSCSSDLLFIRVLIIRGRRGKEPRLFHFY